MIVPRWTPSSCWRVKEARTSVGEAGFGNRPETSLKNDLPLEGATMTPKSLGSIGCVQRHDGCPVPGPTKTVAEETSGSSASLGTAPVAYTTTSNPWEATKVGNAFSVRRPAAAAARTSPPTMLMRTAMASHDLHLWRSVARKSSLTALKEPSSRHAFADSPPEPMSTFVILRGRWPGDLERSLARCHAAPKVVSPPRMLSWWHHRMTVRDDSS